MIIYNTTFHVEKVIKEHFLIFLRDEYIPFVTKDRTLKSPRLTRVFSQNKDDGYSYALEFKVDDVDALETWQKLYAKDIQTMLYNKFNQQVLSFATLLQHIEL